VIVIKFDLRAENPFKKGLLEVLATLKFLFTCGGAAWNDQFDFLQVIGQPWSLLICKSERDILAAASIREEKCCDRFTLQR
jgi:hypothetical protein